MDRAEYLASYCASIDCKSKKLGDCDLCMYEKGRADAIDEVIKSLEAQFLMQNNPNSKFIETIVLHRDFIDALEQLKGNSNER